MTREHDLTTAADAPPGSGRPVVLVPMPKGLMLVIGGGVLATMGPLFGFLIGTMMGSTTDTEDLDPISLFLFLGIMVGGVGVLIVIFGVQRLFRATRPAPDQEVE